MASLAISYRRSDSQALAGRIFDRLARQFGRASVFMDIDSIPAGVDFRAHIEATLARCQVLVVLIGSSWAGQAADGTSRIMQPEDPVRVELEAAQRLGLRLVPLLLDGATMPAEVDLPDSLAALPYLNALPVSSGRDFDQHLQRLVAALRPLLRRSPLARLPGPAWASPVQRGIGLGLVVTALAGLAGVSGLPQRGAPTEPGATQASIATIAPLPPADVPCDTLREWLPVLSARFAPPGQTAIDPNAWVQTASLAHFDECSLDSTSMPAVFCKRTLRAELPMVMTRVEQDAKRVAACFGPAWSASRVDDTNWFISGSDAGQRQANLMLGAFSRLGGDGWQEMLSMHPPDVPQQRPAPRPAGTATPLAVLPTNFCAELNQVVAAAPGKFSSIQQAQLGVGWRAGVRLPGFQDCRVYALPTGARYYSCELPDLPDQAAAEATADALAPIAQQCLGSPWQARRRTDSRGQLHIYLEGDAATQVELRTSLVSERFRMVLDVNAE